MIIGGFLMHNFTKLIKRTIGITLAVTMLTNSVTAMAVSDNTNSREAENVEVSNVQPVDDRLTWGAIEDIVEVSAPTGASVPYIDKGIVRTRNDCKPFTEKMSDGWYVLSSEKVTNDAVVISGKVNLILEDDSYLEANNGIYITKDSELIIWAQSNSLGGVTGTIKAKPENGPGIGAVRDTMGGNLTINGGIIEAVGGKYAAGIGGGRGEKSGFGNVTINNGFVYATGGNYAAGIGRGQRNWNMGTVTINGGEVNAKCSDEWGAGIGGSEDRSGTTVIINGGKVNATGGLRAAGIGGGADGHQGGKVTINGGEVTATGGWYGAGIGGGANASGSGSSFNGGEIEINGGTVNAINKGSGAAAIGAGHRGKNGPVTINGGVVKAEVLEDNSGLAGCAIGSCQYKDQGAPITINGGEVTAITSHKSAAIGGGKNGGVVNINGGIVVAISARGAGIGAGEQGLGENTNGGNGGNVTIKGGDVTAISNGKSAGIGGGIKGNGGTVTISGGNVTASAGDADKAILLKTSFGAGGPSAAAAANGATSTAVEILGAALVHAITQGDAGGAGIGGGYKGNGGNVNITGGTVAAISKHKGSYAIGRGDGANSDGNIELYDGASVSTGTKVEELKPVKKDDRKAACRSDLYAVVTPCSHIDVQYKDKNVNVHEAICPYCKATGKDVELPHYYNETTHKCVCGRTQYKLTAHVFNETGNKDAYENAKYNTSEGFAYSYDGRFTYVTAGDTITVSLEYKDKLQELELTYSKDGHNEVVKPIEYKTNSDGVIVAKYTMPACDTDISYTVKNKPVELKIPEITSAPEPVKGLVYDGKSHIVVEPGACKGGTLFYALSEDDKTAPEFDGDKENPFGQYDNSRTWKHAVPMVEKPGIYNVWYVVMGDEGYSHTTPVCVKGEIKTVESAKADEKTTKGEVRDTTDYFRKNTNAKKQVKTSVELSNNGYKGDVKFDIEVAGKKISSPKVGDVLDVVEGDKIKLDIPASVDAKKGAQLFYKKKDNVTYIATPIVNKLNSDGSLHMEFEAPGYDSRLVLQLDATASKAKQITYEAPTPRVGLIYNGKNQALVKAGSAKGGKMYYALGENAVTAPEFDGLSSNENKTWNVGVPQASQSGKYYVWYMVKGNEGYEDVTPQCVVAEIGKSVEQKKETVEEDDEEDDDVPYEVPVVTDTSVEKTPEITEPTEDTKPPVIKVTGEKKLPEVVDIPKEEKEQGVNIWMEEEDITDTLDDYSKEVLYNRFREYEIPVIYDLNLYKKVSDEEPVDITDLQENVELELDVPNKYVKEGRNFVILRLNEDDPSDITVINPTEFDSVHNELTFSTSRICPFAIAYKADEEVINKEPEAIKTPSLISPKAKEGLYYSGQDMELVTPGSVIGGTIYYALGEDANTAPEFDGLSNDNNKKWSVNVPTGKKVGSYNVWYKVIGDKGYSDLDGGCVVSEIKEVPASTYDKVEKEKGKINNVTDHPDVKDKNPQKAKIENDVKPPVPAKPVDERDDSGEGDDYYDDEEVIDYEDEEDGINYWIEADDITDTLTDDDISTIYQQLRKYYIGSLIDLTLIIQQGDNTFDITEVEEPLAISVEIPDEIRNTNRRYIIYVLEDDGDFNDPTVIRPINYDETTGRITFETDRIKPFIIGYTDDPNEEDVIVFEEDEEELYVLEPKKNNNVPNTTPTVVPQANVVQPNIEDTKVIKADNYQVSGDTTIKIPSAKTYDGFMGFIIRFFMSLW